MVLYISVRTMDTPQSTEILNVSNADWQRNRSIAPQADICILCQSGLTVPTLFCLGYLTIV